MPTSADRKFRTGATILLLVIATCCVAILVFAITSYQAITVARDNGAALKKSSARGECARQVTSKYDADSAAEDAHFRTNIASLILLSRSEPDAAHDLAVKMQRQAVLDEQRPSLVAQIDARCPAPLVQSRPKP